MGGHKNKIPNKRLKNKNKDSNTEETQKTKLTKLNWTNGHEAQLEKVKKINN